MKNITRPSFITFIIGAVLLFLGIGMKYYGHVFGDYLLWAGILLIGIFWIWSIALVLGATDMKPYQKRFWMIAVIAVPVMGGLVFHLMHNRTGKIIT
jgi:general stress protein CsbA